jgi:hypothetical protein
MRGLKPWASTVGLTSLNSAGNCGDGVMDDDPTQKREEWRGAATNCLCCPRHRSSSRRASVGPRPHRPMHPCNCASACPQPLRPLSTTARPQVRSPSIPSLQLRYGASLCNSRPGIPPRASATARVCGPGYESLASTSLRSAVLLSCYIKTESLCSCISCVCSFCNSQK